jgi:hypothetical protein
MKPVYNLELIINEQKKIVYVYKIENFKIIKKAIDIRDITNSAFAMLYVNKIFN